MRLVGDSRPAEMVFHPLAPVPSERSPQLTVEGHLVDPSSQILRELVGINRVEGAFLEAEWNQEPGFIRHHHLRNSSHRGSHDSSLTCHGLEVDDAEWLVY